MIFYRYSRIVGNLKKNGGHLDLLFRRIEKLVIKVATSLNKNVPAKRKGCLHMYIQESHIFTDLLVDRDHSHSFTDLL